MPTPPSARDDALNVAQAELRRLAGLDVLAVAGLVDPIPDGPMPLVAGAIADAVADRVAHGAPTDRGPAPFKGGAALYDEVARTDALLEAAGMGDTPTPSDPFDVGDPTGPSTRHLEPGTALYVEGAPEAPAGTPVYVDDRGVTRVGPIEAVVDLAVEALALAAEEVAQAQDGRFAMTARPRLVDGILIPAIGVADAPRATVQFAPVRTVQSFGVTRRAILGYGRGRPIVLWVGDSIDERDAAFAELLTAVGQALK